MSISNFVMNGRDVVGFLNDKFDGGFGWIDALRLADRIDNRIDDQPEDSATACVAGDIGMADAEKLHCMVGRLRSQEVPLVFLSHGLAQGLDEKGFLAIKMDEVNWVCLTLEHDGDLDSDKITSLTLCANEDAMLDRHRSHCSQMIHMQLEVIREMAKDIGKMLEKSPLAYHEKQMVREDAFSEIRNQMDDLLAEARASLNIDAHKYLPVAEEMTP